MTTDVPVSMWDKRFSERVYVYGTSPNDFLRDAIGSLPKGKVLCLADGEGRNGVYLAQQGNEVTSVDISSVGLQKARDLAGNRGVSIRTIVADLHTFDMGQNQWDLIVSIFCHLPAPIRRCVHKRITKGLKPGGIFLLEAYTPAQIAFGTGGPRTEDLLMTLSDLQADLCGLELLHACELERDIHEGLLHNGKSSVVQVIARKSF